MFEETTPVVCICSTSAHGTVSTAPPMVETKQTKLGVR